MLGGNGNNCSTCVAGLFVTVRLWISIDERWITGSLLGCQRATLAPLTSALGREKQQWQGFPTVGDLLKEDQKATTDPHHPHSRELHPVDILARPPQKDPQRNLTPNNGGYKLNLDSMHHSGALTLGKWGIVYVQRKRATLIIK